MIAIDPRRQLDAAGVGVAGDVAQRFGRDGERMPGRAGAELDARRDVDVDIDIGQGRQRALPQDIPQPVREADMQRVAVELLDVAAQLVEGVVEGAHRLIEPFRGFHAAGAVLLLVAGAHREPGGIHRLERPIMQVACDALALGGDDP